MQSANYRISDKQSGLESQLDAIKVEAEKVASVSAIELKALAEDVVGLLSNLETDAHNGPPAYSLDDVGKLLVSLQLAADTTQRETRILQQLYFTDIHARDDAIEDANKETFQGILTPDSDTPEDLKPVDRDEATAHAGHADSDPLDCCIEVRSNDNSKRQSYKESLERRYKCAKTNAETLVQDWLARGSGVLHISGKAGARKSTLMKLLRKHPRAKELLREWAGPRRLVSFRFFLNSRSKRQMSRQGFYRSLL